MASKREMDYRQANYTNWCSLRYSDRSGNDTRGSSIAASYSGSLSEMAVSFIGLAPYLNKDGNPGFQYEASKDHFTCRESGADCLPDYQNSLVDLSELGWGTIRIVKTDCSSDPNAVDNTDCAVHHFSTSTTGSGGAVAFDVYITTQPVELTAGVTVTPDDMKLDVTYSFPSSSYPSTCNGDCGVTLIALAGGKAVSGSAAGVVQFNGDGSADGHSTFQTD